MELDCRVISCNSSNKLRCLPVRVRSFLGSFFAIAITTWHPSEKPVADNHGAIRDPRGQDPNTVVRRSATWNPVCFTALKASEYLRTFINSVELMIIAVGPSDRSTVKV